MTRHPDERIALAVLLDVAAALSVALAAWCGPGPAGDDPARVALVVAVLCASWAAYEVLAGYREAVATRLVSRPQMPPRAAVLCELALLAALGYAAGLVLTGASVGWCWPRLRVAVLVALAAALGACLAPRREVHR